MVEDSGGGLLFESNEECRAAMEKLIASPALRSELGGRGRRFALDHWTEEVHIQRYLELVRGLMKERATPQQRLPGAVSRG
jgi:glycosyltransferase involved in cell wall biosynthesis